MEIIFFYSCKVFCTMLSYIFANNEASEKLRNTILMQYPNSNFFFKSGVYLTNRMLAEFVRFPKYI